MEITPDVYATTNGWSASVSNLDLQEERLAAKRMQASKNRKEKFLFDMLKMKLKFGITCIIRKYGGKVAR
jgi:hypothetical protein